MAQNVLAGIGVDLGSGVLELLANVAQGGHRCPSDVVLLVVGVIGDRLQDIEPLASGKLDEGNLSNGVSCSSHYEDVLGAKSAQQRAFDILLIGGVDLIPVVDFVFLN